MRKTCVFIIGTNASGKSTVARKLIESFGGIESYKDGISSTRDGVAFAGRYDVKYGGVDNLNGTTILRDIVKKALESTDCIICEGMRLKCWGPNLTHAMFNADRQIVIFLYAPLKEIQKKALRTVERNVEQGYYPRTARIGTLGKEMANCGV